jgi:hypothetical protein
MTRLAIRKILAFIVILFLFVAAIFALVLVVPVLHIGLGQNTEPSRDAGRDWIDERTLVTEKNAPAVSSLRRL